MPQKRQILAMGGGGFSMEPHNPLLDRYLLSLCEKPNPKVCFVGTASFDDVGYREKFYHAFRDYPCEATHLALSEWGSESLEDFVAGQDIFYVGGGNTVNLLRKWEVSKLDRYLRVAYERGAIMAGLSAGSICWFEEGLSDSVNPGKLEPLECLGWVKGSHCPHFDGEAERQDRYKNLIIDGKMKQGWALDDGCALHLVDEEVFRIVGSHPDKKAFKYSASDEHPNQQGIDAGYLGGGAMVIRPASEQELSTIVMQHQLDESFVANSGGSSGNVALILEIYGSLKASAVVSYENSDRDLAGVCKSIWVDESISGKSFETKFRETIKTIKQKEFC